MKEKELQAQIVQYLTLIGAKVIRVNSGAMSVDNGGKRSYVRFNSAPGCSDLIVCLRGKFIAIEVKRKNKKPTDLQKSFLESITKAGGMAFVFDDFAMMKTMVDDLARQAPDHA